MSQPTHQPEIISPSQISLGTGIPSISLEPGFPRSPNPHHPTEKISAPKPIISRHNLQQRHLPAFQRSRIHFRQIPNHPPQRLFRLPLAYGAELTHQRPVIQPRRTPPPSRTAPAAHPSAAASPITTPAIAHHPLCPAIAIAGPKAIAIQKFPIAAPANAQAPSIAPAHP